MVIKRINMYEYKVTEVVKVIDGDTIDVVVDLGFSLFKKERVRLAGIDTPESRTRDLEEKAFGLEAKEYLKENLNNATNILITTEKDGKYGRMLGWITLNDDITSFNQLMIDRGYAWEYDGGKKEKNFSDLLMKRGVINE
jgi:endonuclease YncB( thermonuclease family)